MACSSNKRGTWIYCYLCEDNYHIKCVDLAELDKLDSKQKVINKLNWVCPSCKQRFSMDELDLVKKKIIEWESRYKELKSQHQELLKLLADAKSTTGQNQKVKT